MASKARPLIATLTSHIGVLAAKLPIQYPANGLKKTVAENGPSVWALPLLWGPISSRLLVRPGPAYCGPPE